METPDAVRLYARAILTAVDRLQLDQLVTPHIQAKLCLGLHTALTEAFDHSGQRAHVEGLLGALEERIHACLACTEAHLRQTGLPPIEWVPEGDE